MNALTEAERESLIGQGPWAGDDWDALLAAIEADGGAA